MCDLYTRIVNRLIQRIAFVVFVVIAAAPVLATVCLALCASGAARTEHTRSSADRAGRSHCEQASSAGVWLGASGLHNCGRHDGTHVVGTVGIAPGRADTGALLSGGATAGAPADVFSLLIAVPQAPAYSPPISRPSPARAPLVLRI